MRRGLPGGIIAGLIVLLFMPGPVSGQTPQPRQTLNAACTQASEACWHTLTLNQAGITRTFHYYASLAAAPDAPAVTGAIIAVHGYGHDANITFDTTVKAADAAGVLASTLVVAPLFQVPPTGALAKKPCTTSGVPGPVAGDLTWSCGSWSDGEPSFADGQGLSAYAVTDRLITELLTTFPNIRVMTLAGFSAGAQMVQRYAALAAPRLPAGVRLRFVVSDPSSFVYFDPVRPYPTIAAEPVSWSHCNPAAQDGLGDCTLKTLSPRSLPDHWTAPNPCNQDWPASFNQWKYGTESLPWHTPDAAAMRAAYRAADVSYLFARDDWGEGRGTAHSVLDTHCAAELQGPYRLQRGLGYAFYDRTVLAGPTPHTATVVPGCKHAVSCVFLMVEARTVLFPK